jgi:uncharacterized DUF497 family protein
MLCHALWYNRTVELRWHASSDEHIARHGVSWDEATDVASEAVLRRPANSPDADKLLGVTVGGRHLALIVVPDDNGRTGYLVTARDMNSTERAAWRRWKGK